MIVLQQIKVLPKGCHVIITDEDRHKIECMKSVFDDSLIFNDVKTSELYYKVYQTFHVTYIDVEKRDDFYIFYIEVRA